MKITVSVNHLKEILIKGESVVSSEGALRSPNLYEYINSDCYVAIKKAGKIFVVNSFDTEIDIRQLSGEVQVSR